MAPFHGVPGRPETFDMPSHCDAALRNFVPAAGFRDRRPFCPLTGGSWILTGGQHGQSFERPCRNRGFRMARRSEPAPHPDRQPGPHGRARRHRRHHDQPDNLRQGHRRNASPPDRVGRPGRLRRPASGLRPHERPRRAGVHRGGSAHLRRCRSNGGRSARTMVAGRQAQSVHQDPGHPGWLAGDHRQPGRRHQRERHADLLARPLPGRARGVPGWP